MLGGCYEAVRKRLGLGLLGGLLRGGSGALGGSSGGSGTLGRGTLGGLARPILPAELLHATRSVDELVLAREEGVAVRADIHRERATRGLGLDHVAARAGHTSGRID